MDKLRETNRTLSKTKYDLETKLKAKDDLIKGLKEIYKDIDTVESDDNEILVIQEDISKCGHCEKSCKTKTKKQFEEAY